MSPWDIPVFRSAYFPKRVHRTLFSKTHDLQVRFAHPPNPAPSYRFFVLFSKTHDLQVRFAHPPSPRRNLLSEGSGVSHGLFCDSAPSPIRALVFRSAYSASRNARASAAFAASIEAHCAVSSETLMLQPLRGLRTPHRPPVSSPLAAAAALWLPCVRGAVRRRAGLRGCLRIRGKGKGRRPSPVSAPNRLFELLRCFARLIRQAETLELQPHSRPPSKRTVLFLSKRSCSRFASLSLRTPHRPPVSSPLAAAAD